MPLDRAEEEDMHESSAMKFNAPDGLDTALPEGVPALRWVEGPGEHFLRAMLGNHLFGTLKRVEPGRPIGLFQVPAGDDSVEWRVTAIDTSQCVGGLGVCHGVENAKAHVEHAWAVWARKAGFGDPPGTKYGDGLHSSLSGFAHAS